MPPEDTAAALAARLAAWPAGDRRRMIAIAGPPGAGKSTLAEALVEALGPRAALVPMDGFHLDNRVIEPLGLLPRKGAPETFDGAGFVAAMGRVAAGGQVALPVFDRTRDIAIAGARLLEPAQDIAVVEGNYLLFDEDPWRGLAPLWDLTVWIEVPEDELERRLIGRWLAHGLAPEAAAARARGNDIPNARRIRGARLPADVTVADP